MQLALALLKRAVRIPAAYLATKPSHAPQRPDSRGRVRQTDPRALGDCHEKTRVSVSGTIFRKPAVHWMVYVALAIAPAAKPPPAAMALMVVVVLTRIAPVYTGDEVVGVVPFVV
jgi:hypothetical protein